MRSRKSWWLVAGSWWLVAAGTAAAQTTTTALVVGGRAGANPSIAASGQFVAVAWSAADANGMDVYAATSTDGGAHFGPPMRVNAKAYDARVGGEQPPRVALVPLLKAPTPEVVVVWTTKGESGTRLMTAHSTDGGRTFGANTVVPGGEAAGNRGWQSVAVGENGRVYAMWLDHRNTASAAPAAMHHQHGDSAAPKAAAAPKPDPVERAGLSQLWFGSLDKAVPASSLTGGVCYCCKTSLVARGKDIYGVWRHVFSGNQRDIAFAASHDGGKSFAAPVRVSEDHWTFDGCPENGPAVAVANDGSAVVAWVTPEGGKDGAPLALYVASTKDGKAFTPRVRVPTDGGAAHVQLATLADGSLLLAWDEATRAGRRLRLAKGTVAASGAVTVRAVKSVTDDEAVYPAVAATATGSVVAWVSRSGPQTTVAVAAIPSAARGVWH